MPHRPNSFIGKLIQYKQFDKYTKNCYKIVDQSVRRKKIKTLLKNVVIEGRRNRQGCETWAKSYGPTRLTRNRSSIQVFNSQELALQKKSNEPYKSQSNLPGLKTIDSSCGSDLDFIFGTYHHCCCFKPPCDAVRPLDRIASLLLFCLTRDFTLIFLCFFAFFPFQFPCLD